MIGYQSEALRVAHSLSIPSIFYRPFGVSLEGLICSSFPPFGTLTTKHAFYPMAFNCLSVICPMDQVVSDAAIDTHSPLVSSAPTLNVLYLSPFSAFLLVGSGSLNVFILSTCSWEYSALFFFYIFFSLLFFHFLACLGLTILNCSQF